MLGRGSIGPLAAGARRVLDVADHPVATFAAAIGKILER
jgi:hypothetical protein